MRLRILSILLVASLTSVASAQQAVRTAPLEVDSVHRPFDVISYDLELDWRSIFQQQTHNFSGVNHIDLKATASASEILLDAGTMHIDRIVVDGVALTSDVQPDAEQQLHIPVALMPGNEIALDISYTHIASDDEGLYFFPKGTYAGQGPAHDSVFTLEDVAYTMSEPLGAHLWMPCVDRPYDKATSKIAIRVPADITAQSNGLLDRIDTNSDGSLTFHWSNDTPISTYLMVADASTFVEWTTWYSRVSDTTQKVPIYNYAWPADYAQTEDKTGFQYNAQWALRNTPQMMAAFSERFGEYPFVKYGMVPVQKFDFGGMEHQTLTTINRSWLRGWYDDGIAHELMHQWFGDKTTCATWSDIWLNEGFASYGEAIWEESAYGKPAYDMVIRSQAAGFFNPRPWEDNTIPIYDPPLPNIFNYPTTYAKGSCVLNMLRYALDDDTLFFNTLKDYSNAFAYSTATTAQFRDFIANRIGDRSPLDLHTFVNEWIFQGGAPNYDIRWASGDNGVLVVRINQMQSEPYLMPVRLFSIAGSDTARVMLVDSAQSQTFVVRLGRKTESLIFDTMAVVLSENRVRYDASLEPLAVGTPQTIDVRIAHSPSGWRVSYPSLTQPGELEVTDILGRVVLHEPVAFGTNELRIPSNRLPHGVFWGRLHAAGVTSSFRIEN